MVVRLKDLQDGKDKPRTGLVRLSDLSDQRKPEFLTTQQIEARVPGFHMMTPNEVMAPNSPLSKKLGQMKVEQEQAKQKEDTSKPKRFIDNPLGYLVDHLDNFLSPAEGMGTRTLTGNPQVKTLDALNAPFAWGAQKAASLPYLDGRTDDKGYHSLGERMAADSPATTGHPVFDKLAQKAGDFIAPFYGMQGAPLNIATSNPVQQIASRVASRAGTGLAGRAAKSATALGIEGAYQGFGGELATDTNPTLDKVATSTALGGVLGAGLGAGGEAIGAGLRRLVRGTPTKTAEEIAGPVGTSSDGSTDQAIKAYADAENAYYSVPNGHADAEALRAGMNQKWDDLVNQFGGSQTKAGDALDAFKNGDSMQQSAGTAAMPETPNAEVIPPTRNITPTDSAQQTLITQVGGQAARRAETPVQASRPFGQTNAAPANGKLVRANYKNLRENGTFSAEFNQGLKSQDQTYERITNKETVAKANENVKNVTAAESKFLLNESGGPDHIASGYRLIQELDALGAHDRALVIANKLAKDLTHSGQTTQAGSILSRLSPEGQLLNLVRQAEKNGKTVSVADSIKFKELAAKVQEKSGAGIRANQFNEILNRLERGENVGVDDIKKLSDYLSGAGKVVNPKAKVTVRDELPNDFKDVRKRDRIVSYLDDAEQAALARIAARKNNLNSLPLPEWRDHAIVVASQIAKGTIQAATHVEDMVRMFGEEIRPVATQVFQSAQKLITGVSRGASEGNLEKANEAFRRVSGQAQEEKEIVQETAAHVRKLVADAKAGRLDPADIQKLRDYSDEIAEMTADKPKRIPTQEEKFLQSVKSLAKKIAQVENEKIPTDQANREVSSLLRQVTKLSDEATPALKKEPIDNQALSDIAHDVMEKTRPNPKPTTLQEKIVEKYIKDHANVSPKDIDTLRELAKNVTRLSGDQRLDADIAMQKILNSYEKSSAWDKLLAIRYMSMLLNTSTQAINAASGPIMATSGVVSDVFGTMIDITLNKVLKTPRTTTLYGTNPLQFMARYFKNLKTGAKAGAQGVNPAGIQGTNEIRGLAFKSLYNPLGLAERALGAVAKGPDFATYKSVFDSEMVKQGFLDAKNKGIKGKQNIQNHIEQFISDPPETAVLQADRIGKNTTFQRSDTTGGKLATYLTQAPTLAQAPVRAIFPFVRTPVNIASSAVTMTPAGIIKGLYQLSSKSEATQREAIRTLSLGLTGTGIGAVGYYLSQLGIITGANDSGDKDVDAIREQAGRGKYRFNTSALSRYLQAMFNGDGPQAAGEAAKYKEGDKQFDYNKLQPLAFPLAAGASLGRNKDKSVGDQIKGVGTDAYGSLYGMSTLKGVQDVFQPSYGGTLGEKALGVPSRITESFLKSFSPGGLAQEARRQDPVVRKVPFNDGIVSDVKDYFISRTPGLSQSLPASKTTLGQNKLNAPGISGQYLNPYKSDVAPYNKAAEIITELIERTGITSLAPSAMDKSIRGTLKGQKTPTSLKIEPTRYAQLQQDVGDEIIRRIVALPQNLDDATKAKRIEDIYTKVRDSARTKLKKELGFKQ